jgi:hypothetical protein
VRGFLPGRRQRGGARSYLRNANVVVDAGAGDPAEKLFGGRWEWLFPSPRPPCLPKWRVHLERSPARAGQLPGRDSVWRSDAKETDASLS